jgi:hypothetical protein
VGSKGEFLRCVKVILLGKDFFARIGTITIVWWT